jgi:hypothetical protein
MQSKSILFGGLAMMIAVVAALPQYGQNPLATSAKTNRARSSLAISLLRAINTAEVQFRVKQGSYVPWDVLMTSKEFASDAMKWVAEIDPELANTHFSKGPEILPGWNLRLDLTSDGTGYNLLLEDTTDKTCGYAAVTDERGVIRQSKTIDCQI